ncbi:TrkA family potassium uptake protein [Halorubellus sp. JP-L1]|uniref:potassium channel family protein n=1 Tax=Halorubellus sp. JP-L1 TaxID=2715753 RepID=UPI00140C7F15|nr:NAD-binding protein [Halorubellus sp. JP-L1]NHN40221.1 TrkA family potassium uptake protein [Halorubellus sp. JP-L1]
MDTWQRRTTYYLAGLAFVMLAYAVLYYHGMNAIEGDPVTFLHSLQVVVETFTTTGFGSDSPWSTAAMNVLVIVMDLTGVVLIFLALPVLVFPLFEEAIATTVPTAVDEDVTDHVVICTYTPRADPLVDELDSVDVPYVIVEPDRERATDLLEAGYDVIHADPDSEAGLHRANLPAARALIADVSDQVDASIVLGAREVAEHVLRVSVVEDPDRARYHELAGADVVLSPRSILGESLANKVTAALTAEIGAAVEIGEDFDVAEFPIHRESALVGTTIAESGLRERAGVNVIGAWFDGEFESPPDPNATVEAGTVLLMTGEEAALERAKELTLSESRRVARGETIVAGYGEVGRRVVADLEDANLPYTVLDREDQDGVDVVGDATDPDALEAAGIQEARTLVLALPDDTATEFATLVARDATDAIEIVCRAEQIESSKKMYRAGADYVLSLATVTGRMVASEVLDEDVISLNTQIEVVRTKAPGLTGKTLAEALVRSRTGCTVVALERDGVLQTDVGPDTEIRANDDLVVAGTDAGTNRFQELLG